MNIMLNLPLQNQSSSITSNIIKSLTHSNNEIYLNLQMFEGYEEKYIIREISSLMKLVAKVRTYRINGEITELQRRIVELANILDVPNETININTWEEKVVMAKTVVINNECSWIIGIEEFIIYRNVKYKMTYSNDSNFTVSEEVPKEIVYKIKKVLKGELFYV